jgi:hypothetical protein
LLALLAGALWFGRGREGSAPVPAAGRAQHTPAESAPKAPAVAAPARPAPGASPAVAHAREPAPVELPWELDEIARRYREAQSSEERTDALLELGLSDDPRVLEYMLAELERADASQRESLLAGVIQFGSRDAVPRLRELAERTQDSAARRALQEAADYLALPSLSELRRGEVELEP